MLLHLLFILHPPLLSFSLYFLCFGTFLSPAVHPVPALTFFSLCVPHLSEGHAYTPFWRLSRHLSHITSYPDSESPGLPHLPRTSNWTQPEYFMYYLQTQVMHLTLNNPGLLLFIVPPGQTSTLQHHY